MNPKLLRAALKLVDQAKVRDAKLEKTIDALEDKTVSQMRKAIALIRNNRTLRAEVEKWKRKATKALVTSTENAYRKAAR